MRFADCSDAAPQPAKPLARFKVSPPLVLAIPRGAMPMAAEVARILDGDLDLEQVRKIGAPWNAEHTFAAFAESGWICLAQNTVEAGRTADWLAAESARH
jgi:putative phosphoribosyl transferase